MMVGPIIVIILLAALVPYYYMVPKKDVMKNTKPAQSFLIQTSNRMDIQGHVECAAFSSAFLLRQFAFEAEGNELYRHYPRKLLDGTVSPRGMIVFFKKRGFDASFLYGNIDTLKLHVQEGVPVIAFIRVFVNKRYLHFVPVVGFDEQYIYLADSLPHTINCNEKYYNRKILIEDFEALWKTWMPRCNNCYIVIKQRGRDIAGIT